MTNEELLAKIKAEIERQNLANYCGTAEQYEEELFAFLSTLEEQTKEVHNPIFDECVSRVDPEVREEVRENIDFKQALYDHFGQIKDFTLGMRIGQYFYELGCRRTAEKYDEIEYNRQRAEEEKPMQEGLEEEIAEMFQALFGTDVINRKERLYPDTFEAIARHFAEWGAEHLKK